MKKYLLALAILIIGIISCKKTESVPEKTTEGGTVTAVGNPTGPAASKTIGPAGGSLVSADQKVTLTVPAGAVSSATTFSIQPIENHAPNGLGSAYRLLPEGIQFEKPVQITFHYQDSLLSGTLPDCLFAAYQGSDRTWKAQAVELNTAQKAITVNTTHFSDWTMFTNFRLVVGKTKIETGESTTLVVKETLFDLVNLVTLKEVEVTSRRDIKWTLAGEGQLTNSGARATYKAPNHIPSPNPVTVSAEINNLNTNSGPRGKVLLLANILVGGEYIQLNFGGAEYNFGNCNSQLNSGFLMITGGDGGVGVHMNIAGLKEGTYRVTHTEKGTVIVVATGTTAYLDSWTSCDNTKPNLVEASVTITKMGGTDEYIDGTFSGTVAANLPNCGHNVKAISGSFHVKRRF